MCLFFIWELIFFFFLIQPSFLFAEEDIFRSPSNWGGTGIMEIPTARILKVNYMRGGVSEIDPYRTYYVTVSPFKNLEVNLRLTEVLGIPALTKAYGNYKDKAADIKYQIVEETKYLPAIAIGINDPHGTRLYSSQYIVFSKEIYPFDFTFGLGNGRFGKRQLPPSEKEIKVEMITDPKEWIKDIKFFAGLQIALSEKLAFMFEYNPIEYHKQIRDPAQKKYFRDQVPSHFNFGLKYRPFRWLEVMLTYQRGDTLGFNFNINYNLSKPLLPIYDITYKETPKDRELPLKIRLAKALYLSGFKNIKITEEFPSLFVALENEKYYYNSRALLKAAEVIEEVVKEPYSEIVIILEERDTPLAVFKTTLEDVREYKKRKLSLSEFLYLSYLDTSFDTKSVENRFKSTEHYYLERFSFWYKPSLRTYLNDPSGFFKYAFGLETLVNFKLFDGCYFVIGGQFYPINNISTINKPLSIPVRSDIVDYISKKALLSRFLINYVKKFDNEIYLKTTLGWLEPMYAGVHFQMAKPLKEGTFLIGLEGSLVKKREPQFGFSLKEDSDTYHTYYLNFRYYNVEKEFYVDVDVGRFLAGDKGVKITFSKFINGFVLSAWYSFTDTSVFKDPYNRDYHDKGVALVIPLRSIIGREKRTSYYFGISPWTRDVAQKVDGFINLFDFIGRNVKKLLDKDFYFK